MEAWNDLTDEQKKAARELAKAFRRYSTTTLPTYQWMKQNSEVAAKMDHAKLIAFGRVVLDQCKALMHPSDRIGRAS